MIQARNLLRTDGEGQRPISQVPEISLRLGSFRAQREELSRLCVETQICDLFQLQKLD